MTPCAAAAPAPTRPVQFQPSVTPARNGALRIRLGPTDLLIQAWGAPSAIHAAYAAAAASVAPILAALADALPDLHTPLPSPPPAGAVARSMHAACTAVTAGRGVFITPMAAVAGAVADAVLATMLQAAGHLDRAFVNNGGDIAAHLSPGTSLNCGLVSRLDDPVLDGVFLLHAARPARGVATSGRACKGQGGRSFSFGIADSVTVLARDAATADAAATLVANAVDLPGHPAIQRRPAEEIDPASDLGARRITWDVGPLAPADLQRALDAGLATAESLRDAGLIAAAVLGLRGHFVVCPEIGAVRDA